MQVAAAGVMATLLGTAAANPKAWPGDVPRQSFLQRAVELTAEVTAAAVPIHRLDTARRPPPQGKKKDSPPRRVELLRPRAVLTAEDLLPEVASPHSVIEAAEAHHELARSMMVKPWEQGQPTVHAMLAYGGGHSHLEAVMNTYDQPGAAVIAVFAARMLLEEAARMVWRYSTGPNWDAFTARAKQYFDEYRARQKKAINTLAGSGVPRAHAERIFARPRIVVSVTPDNEIARDRRPLPSMGGMLREMGAPFRPSGWQEVTYSLLSQMTHSTPIGHLHTVRFRDGIWHGNELSPEMLSLTLDAACLGSAHIIGAAVLTLTDAPKAQQYRRDLLQQAAVVHSEARHVHGID